MSDSEGDIWSGIFIVLPPAFAPYVDMLAEKYQCPVYIHPPRSRQARRFLRAKQRRRKYHVKVKAKNRKLQKLIYADEIAPFTYDDWCRLLERRTK